MHMRTRDHQRKSGNILSIRFTYTPDRHVLSKYLLNSIVSLIL